MLTAHPPPSSLAYRQVYAVIPFNRNGTILRIAFKARLRHLVVQEKMLPQQGLYDLYDIQCGSCEWGQLIQISILTNIHQPVAAKNGLQLVALQAFFEYVREETFGKFGLQQIQAGEGSSVAGWKVL